MGKRNDTLTLDDRGWCHELDEHENQRHAVDCWNACAGLDIEKVKALLDAVRAEYESRYDDKISVAEHARRQRVRMATCDALIDSIGEGGRNA